MNFSAALPALIPIALLFWLIFQEKKKRETESKHPFREKVFRLPGEFASKKARELAEKGEEKLYAVFIYSIFAFLLILWGSLTPATIAVTLALVFLISALAMRSLHKHYAQSRNWRLGALGERVIGDQLMREFLPLGFKVYHDIQQSRGFDDRKFNYDHILLDHRGVFLIETKTRSKKRGNEAFLEKISANGNRINFPNEKFDTQIIPQLEKTAEELSEKLSKTVETSIPVYPILVYPGWDVVPDSNKAASPLCHSHDLMSKVCAKPEKALNEKTIGRVNNWFEEQTRSVSQGDL